MIELLEPKVKRPARRRQTVQVATPAPASSPDGAAIAEVLDPLLDEQIQAESSVAGALAAQQANLQQAGACLNESLSFSAAPNGLSGMAASLSSLFNSFEVLSGDPDNLPLRRGVVQSAQELATQFNQACSRLGALENDLNTSIQKDVVLANQNLNDIARLNRRIITAQALSGTAGPLAGKRKQHLEALSGCVNIIARSCADGGVNVSIGGILMVAGAEAPDSLATYPDVSGNLRIQAHNAGLPLKLAGGSIAGKITARDGGLAGLRSGLNALASQLITRVNYIYNSGGDLNNGTSHDFFTGTDASDIGVNSGVANDPSQLRAGGRVVVSRNETVARALAKLGGRNVSGLDNQTFSQSYARTVSDLGSALSSVNEDLTSSQAVKQMLSNERGAAREASIDDETTEFQRYRQACTDSAKMVARLHEMSPVQ